MALGLVGVGVGALWTIDYFQYQKSPEYRARQEAERIKKEYTQDPYGGDTPEETLRLFIDALKKGDTELAARYFVMDKQNEWRQDLAKMKEKKVLEDMVRDLEKVKLTKKDEQKAFFTLVNENNVAVSELIIRKDRISNKWKIEEL